MRRHWASAAWAYLHICSGSSAALVALAQLGLCGPSSLARMTEPMSWNPVRAFEALTSSNVYERWRWWLVGWCVMVEITLKDLRSPVSSENTKSVISFGQMRNHLELCHDHRLLWTRIGLSVFPSNVLVLNDITVRERSKTYALHARLLLDSWTPRAK